MAIFIACLGLFGIAAFTAEQRTKEISIRKTLGSTTYGIVYLLSKELIILVFIANIVAWPVAFIIVNRWIESFPYNAGINIFTFIGSSVLVFMIGIITISYQAIKAAMANPIKALKYE